MNAGPGHSSGSGGGGRNRRRRGRRPPTSGGGAGRPGGGHSGPGRGGGGRQQKNGGFFAPLDHNYRNKGNGLPSCGRGRAWVCPSFMPQEPHPPPKTNEE